MYDSFDGRILARRHASSQRAEGREASRVTHKDARREGGQCLEQRRTIVFMAQCTYLGPLPEDWESSETSGKKYCLEFIVKRRRESKSLSEVDDASWKGCSRMPVERAVPDETPPQPPPSATFRV